MAEPLTTIRPPQMDEVADMEPTDLLMLQRGDGPVQTVPAQAMMSFIEDQGVGAVAAATAVAAKDIAVASKVGAEAAADLAQNAAGRFNPFKGAVAGTSAENIADMLLVGPDGAALYAGDYYVKYCARTASNLFYLNVCKISDDTVITSVGGNGTPMDPTGFTGMTKVPLVDCFGLGIVGWALVDFKAGANFGFLIPLDSAATRLDNDKIVFSSPERVATIERVAQDSTLTEVARRNVTLPFAIQVTNDHLRSIIKEIWLYGAADPNTNDYAITQWAVEIFPGTTRLIVEITNLTTGVMFCRFAFQTAAAATIEQFRAALPKPSIKLTDVTTPTATNGYAVLDCDWSQLVAGVRIYTTMAQAGLHPSRVLTDEMIADYLQSDHVHEIIRVGAAETYTTLRAAVESTYAVAGIPICNRAHYHHRIGFLLVDGNPAAPLQATLVELPAFTELLGNGVGRTRIVKENNDLHALIEGHLETKARDLTIYSDTVAEYPWHSDDANRNSLPEGINQNRRIRQSFKRVQLIGGPNQAGALFGCGISSGQEILFEDVEAWHEKIQAGGDVNFYPFFFHNTGPTNSTPGIKKSFKPAIVTMRGARSRDLSRNAVYLQTLEPGAVCYLVLEGCEFAMIMNDVASAGEVNVDLVRDRFVWRICGTHSGPIRYRDPDGSWVLATTSGVAVTGSAAPLIFGAVDELGRGEKFIPTGSLGVRLGDCSGVSKTLTIGGVSKVFNTNLTAVSNATIIAAINAAIPANPVALIDVALEQYPDTGFSRKVLNDSGVAIPKGRFVKRTGLNTVALAQPGDRIFGWTYRAILNGLSGEVVITRQIAEEYIEGAAAGTGAWGLAANGLLSFAAATKLGDVWGGVVHL